MAIFNLYVRNILTMSQGIASHPYQVNATNFLNFNQSVKISPIIVSVSNHLGLTQKLILARSIISVQVSNQISFRHHAVRVIPVEIYQNFSPYQIPGPQTNVEYPKITSQLVISQAVTAVPSKPSDNELVFSQTVTIHISRNILVSSIFNLLSFANAYIEDPRFIAIPIPGPTEPPGDNGRCSD